MVLGKFEDPDGDGVPDRLILQWNRVQYFGGSRFVTFQAVLGLNTGAAASDFTFNYVDLADIDINTFVPRTVPRTVGIKDGGQQGDGRLLVTLDTPSPFVKTHQAIGFRAGRGGFQVTDAAPTVTGR